MRQEFGNDVTADIAESRKSSELRSQSAGAAAHVDHEVIIRQPEQSEEVVLQFADGEKLSANRFLQRFVILEPVLEAADVAPVRRGIRSVIHDPQRLASS